jgi:hypothetical protein
MFSTNGTLCFSCRDKERKEREVLERTARAAEEHNRILENQQYQENARLAKENDAQRRQAKKVHIQNLIQTAKKEGLNIVALMGFTKYDTMCQYPETFEFLQSGIMRPFLLDIQELSKKDLAVDLSTIQVGIEITLSQLQIDFIKDRHLYNVFVIPYLDTILVAPAEIIIERLNRSGLETLPQDIGGACIEVFVKSDEVVFFCQKAAELLSQMEMLRIKADEYVAKSKKENEAAEEKYSRDRKAAFEGSKTAKRVIWFIVLAIGILAVVSFFNGGLESILALFGGVILIIVGFSGFVSAEGNYNYPQFIPPVDIATGLKEQFSDFNADGKYFLPKKLLEKK